MDDTALRSRKSSFAVLTEIARVAGDDKRRSRIADTEGFSDLPDAVQAVIRDMSPEQLAAVARMNAALVESGFSVEHDGLRLSMF